MDKNSKKVSVIMSTFNSAGSVSKSIESITNQTYKNLELLIVDDNSSDDTFNIIKRYSELNENIFVFKNELNIGLTKSLNFLILKSKGELIARQDDDDISYPGRIKKQVDELERDGLDFCTTRALTNPTKKKIPGISYYLPVEQLLKFKNPFIHGTLLIKKETIQSQSGYDENFYYAQDLKLMIDLIDNGFKYKIINEVLYELNTKNNISEKKSKEQRYYATCARKRINPTLIK